MKNIIFVVLNLIGVMATTAFSSCQHDDDSPKYNVVSNYEGFNESIVEGSITPLSVTINLGGGYRYVFISENKDSLEHAIKNYISHDDFWPEVAGIIRDSTENAIYGIMKTFYGLSPSTTYYYMVAESYNNNSANTSSYEYYINISPIHSFRTEDLNLVCDMGGSVKWCGVNYLENRGQFDISQLWKFSTFSYNELPDPTNETMEGDWRYPTKEEVEELLNHCKVTMVNFEKQFVRLTSDNGNNLYIPYTLHCPLEEYSHGSKELMLFPYDKDKYGLSLTTKELKPLQSVMNYNKFGYPIHFEDRTKDYRLWISSTSTTVDYFNWSYIDATGETEVKKSGSEKRGVRFVTDKH